MGEKEVRELYYRLTCLDPLPLWDPKIAYILCFPRPTSSCTKRIFALEAIGINYIYDYGRVALWTPFGILRVLGKGHAGIVVVARYRGTYVALKIRRTDSKRASLIQEGELQETAARAGIAPKIYLYSKDFIISELIKGPLLIDLINEGKLSYKEIKEVIESIAMLDKLNILHTEISRPLKNIIFTESKALVLDFESARKGCGNLSKFMSWLLRYLGLDYKMFLEEIKNYKRKCKDYSEKLKKRLEETVSTNLL